MFTPVSIPQPVGPITVVTAGTPVSFVKELIALGICNAGDDVVANQVFMAPLPSNTGSIYIGNSAAMNKTTGAGIMFVVLPGGGGWQLPNPVGLNIFHVNQWFVDSDVNGESLIGSIVQV